MLDGCIILQVSVWEVGFINLCVHAYAFSVVCAGFSNGTLQSAEYSRVSGGGCTETPPLRLTVSVVPSELLLRFHDKVIL